MVGHEDIGEHHELVFHGCLVDPVGQSLTDAGVLEEGQSAIGRCGVVVRVTRSVSKPAFDLSWGRHGKIFTLRWEPKKN